MRSLRRHLAAALLLVAILIPSAGAFALDSSTVPFSADPASIERAAASVVRLEVFDEKGGKVGTGSGFALGDPAMLVTASHVIVNMDHMVAYRDDGTSFEVERVVEVDEDADIAVCALPEDAGLPPLRAADEAPLRGARVVVIESQFGLTNHVTKGDVCGRWGTGTVDWLLFSAPVSGGSSGGPVLDDTGRVVGMVMGTYEKGQNLNLAAPTETILPLLE